MAEDLVVRLHELDSPDVVRAAHGALDRLGPGGRTALRRHRTDPIMGVLAAELIELVSGAAPVTAGAARHPAGGRRDPARRNRTQCWDEGYAVARVVLDTHEVELVHSPLSPALAASMRAGSPGALDHATAAGYARLRALRAHVLRDGTSRAFVTTTHLAPLVRDRVARVGTDVDPGLAAQLGALGFMAGFCEWSMVLGDDLTDG